MSLQIITANRLVDGTVVYYTADHAWSQWIADALISDKTSNADSTLARAKADAFGSGAIEPYLVDVYREAQTIKPVCYREAVRARGPSIHTGTGHRMPLTVNEETGIPAAFLNGL